ncbi:MAG: hypothetical protein JOZ36_01590 [Acidobacteria bacterium]|nr:hypothetical protein [Acidobacteriota bacterium]
MVDEIGRANLTVAAYGTLHLEPCWRYGIRRRIDRESCPTEVLRGVL